MNPHNKQVWRRKSRVMTSSGCHLGETQPPLRKPDYRSVPVLLGCDVSGHRSRHYALSWLHSLVTLGDSRWRSSTKCSYYAAQRVVIFNVSKLLA